MKKTIILMLVLVLALSLFIFTACDDDKESGKGSSTGVVFNENMTLEEALAAVQADSEYLGYTYYGKNYDAEGSIEQEFAEESYYNDSFYYYSYSGYNIDEGIKSTFAIIYICDFKELKYYSIYDYEGEELECYYQSDDRDPNIVKQKVVEDMDEAIEDFYESIESGADWETACNPEAHFTTKFEGTSLTFICECGNCRYAYKNFNATYTLPEKYSNYKSIAKLYVDGD